MGLFDRHALPADVRASLVEHLVSTGGARGPRVLAWAPTPDGAVVALPDRLALLGPDGWELLGWHEVQSVSWNDEGTLLTWATVAAPTARRTVAIVAPGRLPEAIRERVDQTFLVRRSIEVAPGRSVTVSGRRPADGGGEVAWHVTPARGIRLRDAEREAAERLVETMRREWA